MTLIDDGWCSVAVLLPHDHDGSPLPVLVDSYGGPHARRVVRASAAHTSSQWFADQGFAVVVTDGRGTPGRGSAHERAVAGSLSDGVLEDQIRGLHLAEANVPGLDLSRVAIRGWSFGGYLAALAVIRRPDVFTARSPGLVLRVRLEVLRGTLLRVIQDLLVQLGRMRQVRRCNVDRVADHACQVVRRVEEFTELRRVLQGVLGELRSIERYHQRAERVSEAGRRLPRPRRAAPR